MPKFIIRCLSKPSAVVRDGKARICPRLRRSQLLRSTRRTLGSSVNRAAEKARLPGHRRPGADLRRDRGLLNVDITKNLNKRGIDTIRELQMVFQDPNGVLNPSYSVGTRSPFRCGAFKPSRRRSPRGSRASAPRCQAGRKLLQPSAPPVERRRETADWHCPRHFHQPGHGSLRRTGLCAGCICSGCGLELLLEIQQTRNTTIILISHDLSSVRFFSDEVAVMYLGRIVEMGRPK